MVLPVWKVELLDPNFRPVRCLLVTGMTMILLYLIVIFDTILISLYFAAGTMHSYHRTYTSLSGKAGRG